jgi:transposase InsO family protein
VDNDKWLVRLPIVNKCVEFRIDTGAKCNILVKSTYESLDKSRTKLSASAKTLKSYTNHKIKPIGTFQTQMAYNGVETSVTFEVVDLCQENILCGDTAEKLMLLQRIHKIDEEELARDYPELVKTTGTLPGEYSITLTENATGVIHPPRRIAASLKPRVIEKLRQMEEDEYITPVQEPTEWVSSMALSLKNDKLRICIDPRDLNNAIKREHYPMKSIEDVASEIPGAKVFSVLDAKSGFLQIKLDKKSSYLTTFNTPIGRYRWLRLPFGIKSAPEIYQRIMDNLIQGIPGAFVIIDDILVAGKTVEEHDKVLKRVIERATQYNLKLNYDKCLIRQARVPYMGHVLTGNGVEADPRKVQAIIEMPPPTDKEGVRRILGFVQYLAKFIPNLSQVDAPLRILMKSDVPFHWDFEQENSFNELKKLCSTPPVLAYFDVKKPVEIECDASKDGLGAVLIQDGRVIAYASRALTAAEQRYAQLEKEMLSIVYSMKKFHCYVFGKETVVYNDHKPLEQIFAKPLLSAPMRLQKMMMNLQWYDLKVNYRRGKEMFISDTLSRAYLPTSKIESDEFIDNSVYMISVSKEKYTEIQEKTGTELAVLQEVILTGWPDTKAESPIEVRSYWDSRDQLSVNDGVIYKGLRIVVPPSLREHTLRLIHSSHLGIVKCKQRAREAVFWPGMNSDIEKAVQDCCKCAEFQNQQRAEPLKPTKTPEMPYEMVGCDLFEFDSKKYLLIVDYYSKYIDTMELQNECTSSVVRAMKSTFACHGIPRRLRSDNGPQFSSYEFKTFCKSYGIQHETSSPHFQSSNGEAERAIQTVKKLWRKAEDKYLVLLDYRTTPLPGVNLSPSQLLMGRRPRNILPTANELLKPQSHDTVRVKNLFDEQKQDQKFYHDRRRGVRELSPLQDGAAVRISGGDVPWKPGIVVGKYEKPRSYVVRSGNQLYRRNRKHLRACSETANRETVDDSEPPDPIIDTYIDKPMPEVAMKANEKPTSPRQSSQKAQDSQVVTRSGRSVKKPVKFDL